MQATLPYVIPDVTFVRTITAASFRYTTCVQFFPCSLDLCTCIWFSPTTFCVYVVCRHLSHEPPPNLCTSGCVLGSSMATGLETLAKCSQTTVCLSLCWRSPMDFILIVVVFSSVRGRRLMSEALHRGHLWNQATLLNAFEAIRKK